MAEKIASQDSSSMSGTSDLPSEAPSARKNSTKKLSIASENPLDIPNVPEYGPKKQRPKKPPELPTLEKSNWLIHLHYIRKEYDICKTLIKEQLDETQGMCEYALYIQALILRQEGKIQESLETFQTCAILNASSQNLKQVARSLVLLGRHKAALEVYEEAAKIGSKDWEICHNMGICLMHLKDYVKAKEEFQAALQIRPRDETFIELGRLLLMQGDMKGAINIYRKAIDNSVENSELCTKLGLLYLQAGMMQKAFEKLGTALTFDQYYVPAILAVGSIMQAHEDYDVALSKYRVAASTAPENASLWNNIGMCFFGKKKYVAAISCLKRANYLDPFDWKILHNLGLVHLTMQQYASAFMFLSSAVNLNPQNGQLFMLLAITLKNLNDKDNARQAYEQSMRLDKHDPNISLNYAIFLNEIEDYQAASTQLEEFKQRWAASQHASEGDIEESVLQTANRLAESLHLKSLSSQPAPTPAAQAVEETVEETKEELV